MDPSWYDHEGGSSEGFAGLIGIVMILVLIAAVL